MYRFVGFVATIACFSSIPSVSAQESTSPAPPAEVKPAEHPRVRIETTLGDLIIELDEQSAPKTVKNFVTYCTDGYYDGTIFYKVQNTEMRKLISGGGVTPDMLQKKSGLHPPIACEWNEKMKNLRGTVGMVRPVGPADATQAEFYINTADNPFLDKAQRDGKGFCVFGKVVGGLDVLDKMKSVKVHRHEKYPAGGEVVPVEPIVIKKARLVEKKPTEQTKKPDPAPPQTTGARPDAPPAKPD
jgi:cyclophilin family peptidyl-prolyl cis-trans isomerase